MDSTLAAPATTEWERRFSLWTATSLEVAASGSGRAAVVASAGGLRQLHAWDRATGNLRRLTDGAQGITTAAISPDGRWIYFVDDPDGSELGWLARVPFAGGTPERFDPDLPPTEVSGVATGPGVVAWTRIEDDRFVHRIRSADAPAIEPSRVLAVDDALSRVTGCSLDGRAVVIARYRLDFRREVVLRDAATGDVIAEASSPDGSIVLTSQSRLPGDGRYLGHMDVDGRRRPIAWDPDTGTIERLPSGDLAGDVRVIAVSPDGRRAALLHGYDATTSLHALDLATGGITRLGAPEGVIGAIFSTSTGFASDDEIVTLWEDSAHPTSVVGVPMDGRPGSILLGAKNVPTGRLTRSVTIPNTGGGTIQAWLVTPAGPGPWPTIVDAHGGPQIAQQDWFVPTFQAFVDHGYAVISPNYHGSSGFGLAFEESIHGRPGELELADLAATRAWAIEQGIADPERIVVEGWSYGGYLALLAVGRQPDLWTAGISGIGVGDYEACYVEQAEGLRRLDHKLIGGTLEEYPERFKAASPITYAADVQAPVLIIHGRGDQRCPAGQMERYIERLEAHGKDVTTSWFEAGHLGAMGNADLERANARTMLEFLERVAPARS